MRLAILLSAALLTGCASASPAAPPKPAETTAHAPVVVTIVVDQLAAWIAADRFPLLPEHGGFARLRREGTWVRDARYPYAIAETAPGHATLYTGALPRESGIFSGDVIDPKTRRRVSILRDTATRAIGPEGPLDAPGSSLAALHGETLADRFRAAHPDAVIVSLSLKDRGTVFAAGRHPTAALWFDADRDVFVTSTAFASAMPAWARPLAGKAAQERARARPWALLDASWVQAHAAVDDDQPGEGDLDGFGITFPHDFARAKKPGLAFRASPRGDEALLGLALAALDAEPTGRVPTLLALSLSSHDTILHVFGPESWEAWDELRRLDEALGNFFLALDKRFGAEGWSALLTGDHGSGPLPETAWTANARPWCAPGEVDRWQRPCPGEGAGRLDPDQLAAELTAAATAAIGPGDWVLGVADPYVHLTPAARALAEPRRAALEGALVAAIRRRPEVLEVYTARARPARCPAPEDDTIDALVCRSWPDEAGDLYVVPRVGSMFDTRYVPGFGTNHGTPHVYDRSVPILVRAPKRAPAGLVLQSPISTLAFPRTAASLLGVAPPAMAASGADLALGE